MRAHIHFVFTSCLLLVTSPIWAKNEAAQRRFPGEKVLVQFSQVTQAVEDAVKKAQLTVVEKIGSHGLVLDYGAEKPRDVLVALPNYQGAIIFREGAFVEAIGYKSANGKYKVPQAYACMRWGSSENHMKQMQADVERCSQLPGVNAEKINTKPGQKIYGNPWMLKLTPKQGTTLLDVFHLTGAKFDCVETEEPK